MNIFEKALIGGINKMMDAEEKLKEKTGIDLMKMTYDSIKADEKLKKEHPGRWIAKKITIGTLKGLLGAGFSK